MEQIGIFDPQKLKSQRLKCGFTRRQVSEMTGIPFDTIAAWEKNLTTRKHSAINNIDRVNQLAEIYDCFLDDLVYDDVIERFPHSFSNSPLPEK